MRIGIFGGTFDPPHIVHLILAEEALDQLGLDRVLWLVTADPPHKQDQSISPVSDRLAMVRTALQGNPKFEISRVEIDRPGPHYALDTVNLLQQTYSDADLIYLIGADSLRDLPAWHEPQALIEAVAGFGVMRRPGAEFDLAELEREFPGITEKTAFIEAPLMEISARDIRERVAESRPFRYFVPNDVYYYIKRNRLYHHGNSTGSVIKDEG